MNRAMPYRKRRDTITAIRVTPTNVREVAKWCGGRVVEEIIDNGKQLSIIVPTVLGNMRANPGSWVTKDVDGQVMQYNDDYFSEEYVRA